MSTITFIVNLETVDALSCKQPYNQTEGTNFAATRVTWLPDFILRNRELKHGVTFTATDLEALHLKNNFTSGEFKCLDIVSEVP